MHGIVEINYACAGIIGSLFSKQPAIKDKD